MSYLGMAIGSLAGLFVVYFGSDRVSESMAKKHGVKSPEVRSPSGPVLLYDTYFVVSSCSLLLGSISYADWLVNIRLVCRGKDSLVFRLHANIR